MEKHRIPEFDSPVVTEAFNRCLRDFPDDPYAELGVVCLYDVLRAHFLVADYFSGLGAGMGGIGPRDPNLLHSAVYRQFVAFGGKEKWTTWNQKCATLFYGIVCDHPFHDANKRTGLLVLLLGLQNECRVPTVKQIELENFAVDVADSKLEKYSQFKKLRKRSDDPEVEFIADFIRRKSRKIDTHSHSLTYRELDGRLRKFGYELANASGNYIDVVRKQERRKLFGFGQRESVNVKVAQIGFPGWKSQVKQSAIATVRRETKLTPEHGFDSESFYGNTDPIPALIQQYSAPLKRLANR